MLSNNFIKHKELQIKINKQMRSWKQPSQNRSSLASHPSKISFAHKSLYFTSYVYRNLLHKTAKQICLLTAIVCFIKRAWIFIWSAKDLSIMSMTFRTEFSIKKIPKETACKRQFKEIQEPSVKPNISIRYSFNIPSHHFIVRHLFTNLK